MKYIVLFVLISVPFWAADARVRNVDKNGGVGKYITIQSAVDAAIEGGTIRLLPDIYYENVVIGKNIVVQGGGAFNTVIYGSSTEFATVRITSGKIMWVGITSSGHSGLDIKNAVASNCIFFNCNYAGVDCYGPDAAVYNSIAFNNGTGFYVGNDDSYNLTVVNCIAYMNRSYGFAIGLDYYSSKCPVVNWRFCNSFGNGSANYQQNYRCNANRTNCVESDPAFDNQYRISPNSPSKDGGDPSLRDLDGSRSDIGYYGGPNAPLLPYVALPADIKLNEDGTIQFTLTGKVGY